MNLYSLITGRADPGAICLATADLEPVMTYADLFQAAAHYAGLLTSLGITPGERVIAQVEKSPAALALYLACLQRGLIYLPLNTAYGEHELRHFVTDSDPALIVTTPAGEAGFKAMSDAAVLTLDAAGQGSASAGADAADPIDAVTPREPDDVASILYTSGTTGKPKGAMITHGNLASNGLMLYEAWGWQRDDVLLHSLPVFHVHGLFVAANLAMLGGSKMIYLPQYNADEVVRALPHATVFMGVPTHYTRMLATTTLSADACAHMRLFTSGSAPLLPQTFDEWRERTGHTILERYGMTETGMNTSNPLEGERKAGTVGPALPGVEARIVDDSGSEVTTGAPGHLEVKGPNVFLGYWRLPEKTAEDFTADGFFRTGDMASIDAEGYVSIIGRDKDLIITGGLNVYPVEVEGVINDMDGVLESAVIGVQHPDFGEAVTAVVVRESGVQAPTEAAIIAHLKARLANFKVAKRVFFTDTLPRNTMGKVQKNVLRDRHS